MFVFLIYCVRSTSLVLSIANLVFAKIKYSTKYYFIRKNLKKEFSFLRISRKENLPKNRFFFSFVFLFLKDLYAALQLRRDYPKNRFFFFVMFYSIFQYCFTVIRFYRIHTPISFIKKIIFNLSNHSFYQ